MLGYKITKAAAPSTTDGGRRSGERAARTENAGKRRAGNADIVFQPAAKRIKVNLNNLSINYIAHNLMRLPPLLIYRAKTDKFNLLKLIKYILGK